MTKRTKKVKQAIDEEVLRKLYQIKEISNLLMVHDAVCGLSEQQVATLSEVVHDLANDLVMYGERKEVQS